MIDTDRTHTLLDEFAKAHEIDHTGDISANQYLLIINVLRAGIAEPERAVGDVLDEWISTTLQGDDEDQATG